MISRAIEMEPGSSRRVSAVLFQSPCSRASRTSVRVNQSASAISPSLNENGCSGSPMAWNPTLPPDEAEDWDRHRPAQRPRVQIPEVEHIDL